MKIPTPFLALALMLLATACGTSPPVHYYSLKSTVAPPTDSGTGRHVIGFGPLDFPGYLKRPQIVTRRADGEITIDDFRRWAEPLDEAVHRIVAASIERLVDDVSVVSYPYHTMVKPDYRVYGDVIRFDVDEAGNAILRVQWGIATADRETVLPPRRAWYSARAASTDTNAVVEALNTLVADFSRDVAEQLRTALPAEQ